MNTVKKLMNKITDKNTAVVEPSSGILQSTGDADGQLSAEGFLCPICMTAFPSSEALEDHYETKHGANGSGVSNDSKSGDFDSSTDVDSVMAQEVLELRMSLENERKLSAGMQREVSTLRSQLENSRKSSLSSFKSQDGFSEDDVLDRKQEDKVTHLIEEVKRLTRELRERNGDIVNFKMEISRLENELKTTAAATSGDVKTLEDTLKERTEQCSKLSKEIAEWQDKHETSLKDHQFELKSFKEMAAKHDDALEQITRLRESERSITRKHDEEVRKLKEELSKSTITENQSQAQVTNLQEELLRLQEQQKDLLARIGGDEAQAAVIESLTNERDILKVNLEKAQFKTREIQNSFYQDNEKLRSHLEGVKKKFEEDKISKENEIKDYQKQLLEKDKRIKEEEAKAVKLNSISKSLQAEQKKLSEKWENDAKNSEVKFISMAKKEVELTETSKILRAEVQKLSEEIENLKKLYKEQEESNKQTINKFEKEINILKSDKSTLESSVAKLESTLKESKQKNESEILQLNEEKASIQSEFYAFKEESTVKLTREKEDIQKFKKEIELEKTSNKSNLEKASGEIKMLQEKLKISVGKLTHANEELKSQKESFAAEFASVKAEVEGLMNEVATKSLQLKEYEDKVRNLSKELQNVRDKTKGFQDEKDNLESEKLVLDKKYKASEEARSLLLERCLVGESEAEKSQAAIVDLQRRLADSLSALQELGRENQSLQVESAKLQGRKWADDSIVTNCNTCSKEFSITIRKHHCRVCGNIFCNECSSKTTSIPSSKKPVRVCDACYEISTK